MLKKKFLILVSILLLTFTFNSFAQNDEVPIDLTGKWALQFQIDRYFTLSDFQGGTISSKYHFSNNSAVRFGVTLGYEAMDREIYSKDIYTDTTLIEDYKGDLSSTTIRLALQYLHYLEMNNSVSAFLGAGVNYAMTPRTEDIKEYRVEEVEHSSYGLDLVMGVEWFVRSNIGIHAEYGAGFGYSNSEYTYKRVSRYSDNNEMNSAYSKTSGFRLYENRVKFGVSVYF
ncbi:MAG: porin family protein [Melioribacteraceae bacterium]|nr:porin family protein [Melioribacteraceae bacterium]